MQRPVQSDYISHITNPLLEVIQTTYLMNHLFFPDMKRVCFSEPIKDEVIALSSLLL